MDDGGGDAARSGKYSGQVTGVPDLRRRRGDDGGRRAVHRLRRLRVPGVPALLRVRAQGRYKRHKGSPPIRGEESGDVDADDASNFNYPTPGNQDHKLKIAERMLTWRMNSRASDDVGHAKYDSSEIGHPKYKAFAYFDRNQSGYIEIDELRESLAGGLGPNHEEVINAIIRDVDTDKDGKISFDEFAAMMKAGTDWRKASRQYSRERFTSLSLKLQKDGSLQITSTQ